MAFLKKHNIDISERYVFGEPLMDEKANFCVILRNLNSGVWAPFAYFMGSGNFDKYKKEVTRLGTEGFYPPTHPSYNKKRMDALHAQHLKADLPGFLYSLTYDVRGIAEGQTFPEWASDTGYDIRGYAVWEECKAEWALFVKVLGTSLARQFLLLEDPEHD
jgi:hypothetical protein